MNAFKGTPGPWFVPVNDPYAVTSAPPPAYGLGDPSSSRVHIATTHMDNRLQAPYVEARANAVAIAQVPAMVEALAEVATLLSVFERGVHPNDLHALQTRVVAILAALREGGAL